MHIPVFSFTLAPDTPPFTLDILDEDVLPIENGRFGQLSLLIRCQRYPILPLTGFDITESDTDE